jgi:hypothetical protein
MKKIFNGRKNGEMVFTNNEESLDCVFSAYPVDVANEDTVKWFNEIFGYNFSDSNFCWMPHYGATKENRDMMSNRVKNDRKENTPIIAKTVIDTVKIVTCSCGCQIHENMVMSTSNGTSCPDCYDMMSE